MTVALDLAVGAVEGEQSAGLGLFARGDVGPVSLGAHVAGHLLRWRQDVWPASTGALVVGLPFSITRTTPRYVGPAVALDLLVVPASEKWSGLHGARFWKWVPLGAAGLAWEPSIAAAWRWDDLGAPGRRLDLFLGLQRYNVYDMGIVCPRVDVAWETATGWRFEALFQHYTPGLLTVGHTLGHAADRGPSDAERR